MPTPIASNDLSAASNRQAQTPLTSLLRALLWIVAALIAVPTRADPDLWGNLRFGLDILASHQISEMDRYSFTQDIPWVNHEWLAQVMMAAGYQLGGTPGLVLLKTGLVLLTLWLVARVFEGTRPLVAEAAMLLVIWGAVPLSGTLRAQVWSLLGLAILVHALSRRGRAMWGIPPLFIVWVNCHIGWVIGLAVLVWWALGQMARGHEPVRLQPWAVVALSLLATLANPYGWHLWQFTLGATHLSRGLTEWQPLWTSPVSNWLPWLLAAVLGMAAVARPPRMRVEWVVCWLALGYVSANVVKFAPFFVELTVLFLAPVAKLRWPNAVPPAPLAPAFRWVNLSAVAVLGAIALNASLPRFACLPADEWRPDATVARALIDARPQGRIAIWFDWGEYVIWHLGPQLRVSFDPRYDLLYSAATIDEQSRVSEGAPKGIAFLARSWPEFVWYPQSMTTLKTWLAANGYRVDVDTAESFLAVRADLPTVTSPGQQAFGCFPSP